MSAPTFLKRRVPYAAAALATIALGLLWRSPLLPLSASLKKYGGSALWAVMIYCGIRFLAPRAALHASALTAVGVCWIVEFSQLYRAPWLDALRSTRPGHLVLGSTFNWPDLPAYALGVLLAWGLDRALHRHRRSAE